MKHLFLENKHGRVIRIFCWNSYPSFIIKCLKTGRVHLWAESKVYAQKQTSYKVLGSISGQMPSQGIPIPQVGQLKQGYISSQQLQCDLQYPLRKDYFSYIQACLIAFCICWYFILKDYSPTLIEVTTETKKEITAQIIQPALSHYPVLEVHKKPVIENHKATSINHLSILDVLKSTKPDSQNLNLNVEPDVLLPESQNKSFPEGESKNVYTQEIFSSSLPQAQLEGGGDYHPDIKMRDQDVSIASLGKNKGTSDQKQLFQKNDKNWTLDQEQALALIISKEEGSLRRCYENGLQFFPEFKGSISLSWIVDDKSQAQNIQVAQLQMNQNETVNLKSFQKCITDYLKTWLFPSILKGKSIYYTFDFNKN